MTTSITQEFQRQLQVLATRMRIRAERYAINGAHAASYEKANERDQVAIARLERKIRVLSSGVSTGEARDIVRRAMRYSNQREELHKAQREAHARQDALFCPPKEVL